MRVQRPLLLPLIVPPATLCTCTLRGPDSARALGTYGAEPARGCCRRRRGLGRAYGVAVRGEEEKDLGAVREACEATSWAGRVGEPFDRPLQGRGGPGHRQGDQGDHGDPFPALLPGSALGDALGRPVGLGSRVF